MTKKRTITKDEKSLFLDLSSRLSYGVICQIDGVEKPHKLTKIDVNDFGSVTLSFFVREYKGRKQEIVCTLGQIKPYYRPMSSMTEEEKKEYKHLIAFSGNPIGSANLIDWLNKKMFAYRTIDDKDMFELGLAIEVTENNNPYD